jgi:SET domain-containing protein
MDYNWLSPKAEARPAGEKGWGSFAVETIAAGETVAAFGGWVVTGAVLETLSADRRSRSIQVDADLYVVSGETPEAGDMLNHSCEPNCGLLGQSLVVAMREIGPGEELCFDYAMCDSRGYDEFRCRCGRPNCREIVTGSDWREPGLQERYAGWFSPYLARRIAALPARPA